MKCPKISEIVGTRNESVVFINGIAKKALLDTGSCVSTCSRSFYENNLSRLDLMPLDNFVTLECANGEHMPYFGYIQVDVKPNGVPSDHVQSSILLVVPDTECNTNLSVLLGTNVLAEFLANCRETIGKNSFKMLHYSLRGI